MKRTARQEKLLAAKRSYYEKPLLRRARTCESILGGSALAMFVVFFVVSRVGSFTSDETLGKLLAGLGILAFLCFLGAVLFVCALTLTGPIYKRQLDFKRGDLETWGFADKCAAAIISILIILAAAFLAQRYVV